MVSKAIGRRKGPINGAANIKPYRRDEKPRLLDADFYYSSSSGKLEIL